MSDYKPGTVAVATVPNYEAPRGVDAECPKHEARVSRYSDGWALLTDPDIFWPDHRGQVENIRPLVVLDPAAWPTQWESTVLGKPALRHWAELSNEAGLTAVGVALHYLADQIEGQTKPPRIPEPGKWGVVESGANGMGGHRGHFIRSESCNSAEWFCTKTRTYYRWVDLIDPVLVRDGVKA